MNMRNVACVDFETEPVGERPGSYPPVPVGAAIKLPGRKSKYLAWGHPSENNCLKSAARRELRDIYKSYTVAFHNAQFDLEVGHRHLGLPFEPPNGFHDTMVLAFLFDPNRERIELKDLARDLLGMATDNQRKLADWIRKHVPEARRWKKKWAAYICRAPGDLAGAYAGSDTDFTWGLLKYFKELINTSAYEREIALLPELVRMSQRGVPINERLLAREIEDCEKSLKRCDRWLRRRLGQGPSLNLDSPIELADAMEDARLLTEWVETETGERSLAIHNLKQVDCHPEFVGMLEMRATLSWNLRTHLKPWSVQANYTGGLIHCQWNQVRRADAERHFGARTGRLSSNPNLQNIANRLPKLGRDIIVPRSMLGLHQPDPRSVVMAPRGSMFANADYSGQELRILAHFAGGKLRESYITDRDFDLHAMVQDTIRELVGVELERRPTKNVVFGRIYGSGIGKTADQLATEWSVAKQIRGALEAAVPELVTLDNKLRREGGCTTWGGRWNEVEAPRWSKDGERWLSFEYKLLNTLIQGSAADVTKEAMVRYAQDDKREGEMVLQAHDELLIVAPTKAAKREEARLCEHMESVEMGGIPMLTESSVGKTWRKCK